MTLDTFFEKFDQFAGAPNAVAKMRELVLHLAVTGKLVQQEPGEQSVADLLAAIGKSRDSLVDERAIRRIESQPPLTNDEIPFECPIGWTWVRFGDISSSYRGHNPPKSVFEDKPAPGYVRFIQQRDFRTNDFAVYVPESRSLKLVRKGEIVMAAYGNIGNTCRTVEGAFNVAIAKIMEIPPVERDYIDLLVRSDFIRGALAKVSSRVAVPSMSSSHMRSLAVLLPPLTEQKRIVAKVDELMALCDRLEAQQQERETQHTALARASLARFADAPTPANLDLLFHKSYTISSADLRKCILQLAFAGRLAPQDPTDEPASVLLKKARAEKARLIGAGVVKKEPWAGKLQDAATLYELPLGWEWTHVSDVVEKVTVGFVGSMTAHYRDDGVPFLRSQNVRVNRYEPIGLTFISEEFHSSISKSTLRPGDVVVTRSGNVGVTCVVPDGLPEANCSDLVIVKRPLALVPAFLSYFINSIAAGQIEEKTVGIALTHFNTRSVAQMTVALPPLTEQRRIVAKVDQLMAIVDQLETQLANSHVSATTLLEAVVAELAA